MSKDKGKQLSYYNRFKLYENGLDKFTQEFDAYYYAQSLRNLRVMISSLMDDSERFMAMYQHRNTITHLSEESGSESDHDATSHMPKLLNKEKSKLDEHMANIDKFCKSYFSEEHSSKDFKLLKGAFTSKPLHNRELMHLAPTKEDSYDDAIPDPDDEDVGLSMRFSKPNLSLNKPKQKTRKKQKTINSMDDEDA